ncbi:nucleotidyltransferase AbiEii toxin of type IV toxin-antitoxin system [Curtobacterium sp. PhB142]|uniref:nucleotidyl transferase AbiEii/AbiGii toxin family protein n=1 Tax=unclassified Curtobacterium TaxID=257496 RepID=UPI001042A85E|nr:MULTISPECIES: nucleotidyl transferase AbiEii/AbiGii toxin family protein [unclassified Curtobacterium]MBF4604043.1 nucleotidyl transferase AbiEii/AbiGii toxin family protein [Curtobacterium sp. VKM Ac-2884]NQW89128.1 nucleotidyl transferase AbiEii/AbiGii toxin family protein [Curtobacterium sp. VKM Ac-2861]TCL82883.1 nucleotidyltransferase AbiEii toxin of type IV toxin-antitoxin system [Curtobacterium sp. PhB142]TCM00647.1 nucleotidyltransferase AbiEii toxin of type IV toxin-antitoxin system
MSKPEHYATPLATMQAITAAARAASPAMGLRVSDLRSYLVFDRFLVRVFRDPRHAFILKGGTRMLAFIPTARATVDVDLETTLGLDDAVKHLSDLVSVDIGDRLRFRLVSRSDGGGDDQPNLSVARLAFRADETREVVKIDLAVHARAGAATVVAAPAFRVPLTRSVESVDYLMIAIEQQIADKAAAMMETRHVGGDGRSSRAKDLVDLALIAVHLPCGARALRGAVAWQVGERGIEPFVAVDASDAIQRGYRKAAQRAVGLTEDWREAESLANGMLGPALDGSVTEGRWDPELKAWVPLR